VFFLANIFLISPFLFLMISLSFSFFSGEFFVSPRHYSYSPCCCVSRDFMALQAASLSLLMAGLLSWQPTSFCLLQSTPARRFLRTLHISDSSFLFLLCSRASGRPSSLLTFCVLNLTQENFPPPLFFLTHQLLSLHLLPRPCLLYCRLFSCPTWLGDGMRGGGGLLYSSSCVPHVFVFSRPLSFCQSRFISTFDIVLVCPL